MKNTPIYSILLIIIMVEFTFGQFDYGFEFSKSGSAGLQFLKIGVGARECAIGEATACVVNDANAVFWNVAGISYIEEPQLSISHNQWLVDSKHDAISLAIPVRSIVIGINVVALVINEFEETTVTNPLGTGEMIGASDVSIGIAIARRFTDKLSIGGQIKYVQETLDDRSFDNILFDIGTLYYTGFHNLNLAFAFQHFGPDMVLANQKFRTPLLFRVGISDDLIKNDRIRLTTAIDLIHPTDNDEWVNFGLECEMFQMFSLRTGYRSNREEGNFTCGIGLNPSLFGAINLKVDYAYMPFGKIMGDIHRFSLGFGF